MGGTSFDITLTKDGNTNLNKNIDFLRYRIGIPMIQVETLGAGGGSIGWIDEMNLLQVGPQSAGAEPGPACYDKGGEKPTVSDANLVLGYLRLREIHCMVVINQRHSYLWTFLKLKLCLILTQMNTMN
mgnify:CR=1 FL=1